MRFKRCGDKIVVRIDKDEEIVEIVKRVCSDNNVRLGSANGIGSTNQATIGLFDTGTKKYLSKELVGEYEIANLAGNISTMNGEVYLHLHITLSDAHYNAFGGHLNSAIVSGTCEVIIDVIEGEINRAFSEKIGLNLYKI